MKRTTLRPAIAIALVSSVAFGDPVGAVANDGFAANNPYRSAGALAAQNQRVEQTFGRSVLKITPDAIIQSTVPPTSGWRARPVTPPVQPNAVSSKTRPPRSEVQKPKTHADLSLPSSSTEQTPSPNETAGNNLAIDSLKTEETIREFGLDRVKTGFLPPTTGRIIPQSGHWSFVPDNPATAIIVLQDPLDEKETSNAFRTAAVIDELKSLSNTTVELSPANPLRSRQSAVRHHLLAQTGSGRNVSSIAAIPKLPIATNTVMQRVIQSINYGGAGNRWILSGQISDDSGLARLYIRTAKVSR